MNIYVGNLAWEAQDSDLRKAFEEYGQVSSATIIKDKFTGKSRGFGFVEMSSDDEGAAAIKALNNRDLKGRPLRVNEAKPKPEKGGFQRESRGERW